MPARRRAAAGSASWVSCERGEHGGLQDGAQRVERVGRQRRQRRRAELARVVHEQVDAGRPRRRPARRGRPGRSRRRAPARTPGRSATAARSRAASRAQAITVAPRSASAAVRASPKPGSGAGDDGGGLSCDLPCELKSGSGQGRRWTRRTSSRSGRWPTAAASRSRRCGYYEREGLVRTTRTSGGQRRYERSVLRRLAFIRAARTIGVGLEEVREGLDRLPDGRTPDQGRLDPAVQVLAGTARRADQRARGAARRAGLVHRLRLPVAAALPALQPRRPVAGRRRRRAAAAADAAPHPGRRASDARADARRSHDSSARTPSRRVTVRGVVDSLRPVDALEGLDNVRDVGGLPLRDGGHDPARGAAAQRVAALRRRRPTSRTWSTSSGCGWCWTCAPRARSTGTGRPRWRAAGVETVALNFMAEDGESCPRPATTPTRCCATTSATCRSAARTWSRRCAGSRRPDAGPALVHCAAGKDRTGVLVALVLDAVGVQRRAVVADYALSAEQVEAMFRRWTTAAGGADARRPHPAPAAGRGDGRGAGPARRRARRGRARRVRPAGCAPTGWTTPILDRLREPPDVTCG